METNTNLNAAPDAAEATVANSNMTTKEVTFHFKTDKETGVKRPSVSLDIPVPTEDDLIRIIQNGGKSLELLLDSAFATVYENARAVVGDTPDISKDNMDVSVFLWDYIANLPPSQRKGAGVPKEMWDAFGNDYVETMVRAGGKTMEKAKTAADLLCKKFLPVKTNKQIVQLLRDQLNIWFGNTENKEEFQSVYEFLDEKADTLLKTDEQALLNSL